MGLGIARALLTDRLMLVLLVGCVLGLAYLFVLLDKICRLLCNDMNGNEEGRQPSTRNAHPQSAPGRKNRQSQAERHEAKRVRNRVHAECAQGAPGATLQAAKLHPPPPGLSARHIEEPSHPEPQAPMAPAARHEAKESAEGAQSTPVQAAEAQPPPPGWSARRLEEPSHPEPQVPMAPAANADTPSHDAPARRSSPTPIYQRMMANDQLPPPPPPLTKLATSGMKRSVSDQSLHTRLRQPVNPRAPASCETFAATPHGGGSRHWHGADQSSQNQGRQSANQDPMPPRRRHSIPVPSSLSSNQEPMPPRRR